MACELVSDEAYKKLLRDMNMKPLSYHDVALDWETNSNEWYHALIAVEDLPIVFSIPNLKIYAWCRCKLVANDKSEAHFHWHGLVHFEKGKRESWRKQARRVGVEFLSRKNTFKKIICLDHAVGVLRYIACKDGQRVGRRDRDGLVTHPHTHYARQPIEERHRHDCGKLCASIRDDISQNVAAHINLVDKKNWTVHDLHDVESCLCHRGKIGKEKKAAANEKRRAYYKTAPGIAMKKAYREKAAIKRQLLNQVMMLNVSKKAELCKETIKQLLNRL